MRERMHASGRSRRASASVKGEKGSKLALTSVTSTASTLLS
jgi:hypothetical protein